MPVVGLPQFGEVLGREDEVIEGPPFHGKWLALPFRNLRDLSTPTPVNAREGYVVVCLDHPHVDRLQSEPRPNAPVDMLEGLVDIRLGELRKPESRAERRGADDHPCPVCRHRVDEDTPRYQETGVAGTRVVC